VNTPPIPERRLQSFTDGSIGSGRDGQPFISVWGGRSVLGWLAMKIKILHVERQGVPSRVVTHDQVPAQANTTGIVSIAAQCECGEIWKSTKLGRGSFKLRIHEITISCPRCGSIDKIPSSEVSKVV